MKNRTAVLFVLLLGAVGLPAQVISPAGYELGIFINATDTVPMRTYAVLSSEVGCAQVSTSVNPVTSPQINPRISLWRNETETVECQLNTESFINSLPLSSVPYIGRIRSYNVDPAQPDVKLWSAWGEPSNPFYRPTPLSLSCPAAFESNTQNVTYTLPTPVGAILPSPVSCSPPTGSNFPSGLSKVVCTTTDALARAASCSFNVSVILSNSDTTPPSLSNLVAKQSGNSSNFNVTVRATDNIRVARLHFSVDGIVQSILSTSTSTTWATTVRITQRGDHIVSVDAWDAANNHATIGIGVRR